MCGTRAQLRVWRCAAAVGAQPHNTLLTLRSGSAARTCKQASKHTHTHTHTQPEAPGASSRRLRGQSGVACAGRIACAYAIGATLSSVRTPEGGGYAHLHTHTYAHAHTHTDTHTHTQTHAHMRTHAPVGPGSPVAPVGPTLPCTPAGPCSPHAPAGPVGPRGPRGVGWRQGVCCRAVCVCVYMCRCGYLNSWHAQDARRQHTAAVPWPASLSPSNNPFAHTRARAHKPTRKHANTHAHAPMGPRKPHFCASWQMQSWRGCACSYQSSPQTSALLLSLGLLWLWLWLWLGLWLGLCCVVLV
jgi:hypothetical protein